MIAFFDTSVLVAAMVEDEPRHEACAQALEEAKDGYASVHSLAECYATLTGGRLGVQLSPADAAHLVRQNIHDRLSLVGLTASEYLKLLDAAGPAGARGGAICFPSAVFPVYEDWATRYSRWQPTRRRCQGRRSERLRCPNAPTRV